jgi:DNA-binding winged helix-turn-helix (wHTH) protein
MIGAALHFGPFSLKATKQLWRGDQQIHLRRQTLALLRYLAERPGQLVDKEELRKQLWPGIYVSPTVVKVCVREIRHALGDEAAKPQFIETVGMQGYRFMPPNKRSSPARSVQSLVARAGSEDRALPPTNGARKLPTGAQPLATDPWRLTAHFVGREYELGQLQTCYERVQQGQRQLIFLSGEAGIGKTAVAEHFLAAQAKGTVRIGRGHCIEHYEHGEAYLPVLQALQQLCRAPHGDQVIAILRRYAPLWLVQLTGVLGADELARLQLQVQGSSPQRMLRECADAMEVLAAETPVILLLEDLQWSDAATVELLEYLAQRRERARLLVLGCYRPGDAVLNRHPLRRVLQTLMGRGQCQELALELFTPAEVEAYLSQCMAGSPVVDALGAVIHRRTEGNALFVLDFVDYLLQRGLLVATDEGWELRGEPEALEELIPDHVQQLMAKQVEDLSREVQQLLETASVVGMSFTAGEVAAVLNQPLEATEAVYDELASQGRFLEVQGLAEWPDGSITVRYRFRHALCQHMLYHRVGLAQRVRRHRQLGEHYARMHGAQAHAMAGERAYPYPPQAGDTNLVGRAVTVRRARSVGRGRP